VFRVTSRNCYDQIAQRNPFKLVSKRHKLHEYLRCEKLGAFEDNVSVFAGGSCPQQGNDAPTTPSLGAPE
jgi:hypothetical protein